MCLAVVRYAIKIVVLGGKGAHQLACTRSGCSEFSLKSSIRQYEAANVTVNKSSTFD